MKKFLLPILSFLLVACSSEETVMPARDVTFLIDNLTEEYSTRASLADAGMTDLYIFEGETLLAHKVSTDADFAKPVVPLTYGAHVLTFVGSKSVGQSWAGGLWSCTKVRDTFAKRMEVEMSGQSLSTRNVQLLRRSSAVCFVIEDAVPASVKTMHIRADNCLSLTDDLQGEDAVVYDAVVDVTSEQGNTGYKPTVNLLTTSATDEEDCQVMIEFKNASGVVLYHYERTVKVKPNRCTNLRGEYFSGDTNAISCDTDWLPDLDVEL